MQDGGGLLPYGFKDVHSTYSGAQRIYMGPTSCSLEPQGYGGQSMDLQTLK